MVQKISRDMYMKNSAALHHAYHMQFALPHTYKFVESRVGLPLLLSSKCPHFNDIIKYDMGEWIWHKAPMNMRLAGEMGESPCQALTTCVAKAVATEIVNKHREITQ